MWHTFNQRQLIASSRGSRDSTTEQDERVQTSRQMDEFDKRLGTGSCEIGERTYKYPKINLKFDLQGDRQSSRNQRVSTAHETTIKM